MLSIAINVKNGAKHIERCLDALIRFDDVVILDNHSVDNTVSLVLNYPNVRLFTHDFLGMGRVRNILSGYAKYDWVLFVDCDEVLSEELVTKLLTISLKDNHIYSLKRYNFFANSYVDSSSWQNDWVLRLYNRKQTQYLERDVHESVAINGLHVEKIDNGFIYHFPYENVSQLIDKMQFYSTLYAKQNLGKKKTNLYLLPFRSLMMFFKCYILKLGFMNGYEGFVISSYNAMGVFSKYIKLYELSYNKKIALAIVINDLLNLDNIIKAINLQTLLPDEVLVLTNIDNVEYTTLLEKKLKSMLIVKSKVVYSEIADNSKGIALSYLKSRKPYLDNILYLDSVEKLSNKKLFKRYKLDLLNSEKFSDIIIL